MKQFRVVYILTFFIAFSSCEKAFMEPNPETNALAIFDEYATLIKEKYAMLEFKDVDIDFLADSIRATIEPGITENELFHKLGIITARVRDGHTVLVMDNSNAEDTPVVAFDQLANYPPGLDVEVLYNNYLSPEANPNMKVLAGDGELGIRAIWGPLAQDSDISYLWIPSWLVEMTDDEIEQIFIDIKDSKGLIFDLRLNSGGDPSLATQFASYFTDTEIDTGFERFKTGPGENDFSDSRIFLQPTSSNNKYLKEVRVLTDRHVYSASTTFLYSVDPITSIKTMGQRTGGGSGSVADGYLANGWYWALSISEFIDVQGRHLDDGVDPDIPVALDVQDTSKDEVLEAAILNLQ